MKYSLYIALVAYGALVTATLWDITNRSPNTPLAENVSKVQYLGALVYAKDGVAYCQYGEYAQAGVFTGQARTTGTRLVLLQSAHGLGLTTDLEKYAELYSERDLANLGKDTEYDLTSRAAQRTPDAGIDSEKTLETAIRPTEDSEGRLRRAYDPE